MSTLVIGEKAWVNGAFVPSNSFGAPLTTHALHYGTSAFEGIRCYLQNDGTSAILCLAEHIRRLRHSARAIEMELPCADDELISACRQVVKLNGYSSCYIRPFAWLGAGTLGLMPHDKVQVAIIAWEWGRYLGDDLARLGIPLHIRRFDAKILDPTAKVGGHYINSIRARLWATKKGYSEALLLDLNGHVAEGSGENCFFVLRDTPADTILTPKLGSILPGVTRRLVMEHVAPRLGLQVVETDIAASDLSQAVEGFLTGTATEIHGIASIDGREISTQPGPLTTRISDMFKQLIKGEEASDLLTPI